MPSKGLFKTLGHGIATRLNPGDHYGLLLYGFHSYYSNNGSRDGAAVDVSGTVELPFVAN